MIDPEPRPALLAEDNFTIRKAAGAILAKAGFAVDTAENGAEAVEMYRERRYAVIFMDLHMPVMEGDEATRRIREFAASGGAQPRILAVTATDTPEERQKAADAGMDGFLLKPFTLEQLVETLAGLDL